MKRFVLVALLIAPLLIQAQEPRLEIVWHGTRCSAVVPEFILHVTAQAGDTQTKLANRYADGNLDWLAPSENRDVLDIGDVVRVHANASGIYHLATNAPECFQLWKEAEAQALASPDRDTRENVSNLLDYVTKPGVASYWQGVENNFSKPCN